MPEYTKNYNLILPKDEEFYDIADFNSNFTDIDNIIKDLQPKGNNSYIRFNNGIVIAWGTVSQSTTGRVERVLFPEELNISTILNFQISNIYSSENIPKSEEDFKNTILYNAPDLKGFNYINYIINDSKFYWFVIGLE